MPDYDMLVMSRDNNHKLPPEKENLRWRKGDPVDIFPVGKLDPRTQPECFEIIRITGYPGTLAELKEDLLAPDKVWSVVDNEYKIVQRRKTAINLTTLTKKVVSLSEIKANPIDRVEERIARENNISKISRVT